MQPTPEATPLVKLTDFGISIFLADTAELNLPPRPATALESAQTARVSFGPPTTSRPLREREVALTVEADSGPASASGPLLPKPPLGTPPPVTQEVVARSRRPDSRSPQLTQAGSIIGTPQYMAPELARGSHHAQPSADVFSLGVLAYELLTGELPFAQWPIFSQLGDQRAVPLRTRCPDLAIELAELFQLCLAGNPAERPTAQQLAERLAQAAAGPRSASTAFVVSTQAN